jgi:AcrR family transcriptional regulator
MTMSTANERHEQILQAAMTVFEASGYSQTTMDAVAAEAGVSKGSIYNYFRNKQALFAAVVQDIVTAEEGSFRSVIDSDEAASAKIARLLDVWSEGLNRLAPMARVILESWAVASREEGPQESLAFFREAYNRWHGWIAETIQQGIEEGDFNPRIRPELGAAIFLAALDGLKVQLLFDMGLNFTPELMRGWREGFLAALRSEPPVDGQEELSNG